MPVEIKELSIKVKVDESGANAPAGTGSGGGEGEPDEALIATIVERVLELLKEKTER
jgi:Family of unknown function (DUF5908)